MLLSICKNNLVLCARGHVVATRNASAWRPAAAHAPWRQKFTQSPADGAKELRYQQRHTLRLSSATFYTSPLSLDLELSTGHGNAPCPTECAPVTGSLHSGPGGHRRTFVSKFLSGGIAVGVRSGVGVDGKFQPLGLEAPHNVIGDRLLPLLPGCRGFCTGSKPQEPPVERTETPGESTAVPGEGVGETGESGRSPAIGQGLFKFNQLYENPWTIPNLLCVSRILLAPVLGYLITENHFHLSLGLFILAGATDLLDGYIARTWASQKSALGSALDPLADKILISFLYISLTYVNIIPAPLTALVIFRDIGLIAAVFYVRYLTVPPPVTLSKFFNPLYSTAEMKPTVFSKVNTAIQLLLVAASLASPVFHYTDSLFLQSLWYITAVTTAASGFSYYHYGMKTVEALKQH